MTRARELSKPRYGYIYLTDAADFSTPSTIVSAFFAELASKTSRRLQEEVRRAGLELRTRLSPAAKSVRRTV